MNEKELIEDTKKMFKRKGLRILDESKKSRIRPDLVVSQLDSKGELTPKIVVEVEIKPTLLAQQQLMKYVKDFKTPYALLVTENKYYWFDSKTFLPIDEPKLEIENNFLLDNESINQIMSKVTNALKGSFSQAQVGLTITQVLLVRAYLDEMKELSTWWDIKTKKDLVYIIEKAIKHYSLKIKPIEYGLTDDFIELYVYEFGLIPPKSSILPNIIYKLIQSEHIENLTTDPIQEIFGGITQQLEFDKEKVVDLTSGLGLTAFKVMEVNKFSDLGLTAFDINQDITSLFRILAILGDYSVDARCADSLKENFSLEDDYYSLTLVSPPFGYKYKLTEEQKETYQLASNREHIDAADLFIEKSIKVTQPGGYIVALVPETLLFSEKSKDTRELIKDETIIESIISLPAHTLRPFLMVKVSLVVLRKKKHFHEAAEELFISSTESIDDIEEIINGFANWKQVGDRLA